MLRTGAVGSRIRGGRSGGGGGRSSGGSCLPDKIRNPDTGRCVLRTGAVGKRILRAQKGTEPSRGGLTDRYKRNLSQNLAMSGLADRYNRNVNQNLPMEDRRFVAGMPAYSAMRRDHLNREPPNELIRIGIGEILTEQLGIYLQVTKAFLKILRAGTNGSYERQDDDNNGAGNAYVFGPKFPKDTYRYEGNHYNDGGGTGIVIDDGGLNEYDSGLWGKYFNQEPRNATEKQMTNLARKVVSDKIVFMGHTNMGDVGANVFTHRNARGEIDSLIIDSWYFFSRDELRDIKRSHRLRGF